MARIFISHSSRDGNAAARMRQWLADRGFEQLFLDFDKHVGIPPGADWEKRLYLEIARSNAVILIVTANWHSSKWCWAEFTQARALGKAIFPVIEAPVGSEYVARDLQQIDLTRDCESGLEQLERALSTVCLSQQNFPWDESRSPYPGMLAFEEQDAAIYFGRDDEIARITERLNAWRTLGGEPLRVLLGQSGSGKSSFLRAGLIPRLKREKHNWIVLPPFRPHLNPLDAFARSLACVSPAAEDWRTWRSRLVDENGPKFISDFADDLRLAAKGAEAGILIPIDQGEELFAVSKPKEAQHFLRLISNILVESDAYIAVMTLRSDYLGHLQQALTIRFEEVSLKPLPLERIPEIIEGPAKVAGLQVEAALLLQTTKDANTEDALPLLAFTLRELYEQYARSSKQLTLKDYHHLGGVPGANPLESVVRQAADRILGEASPFERELDALHGAFLAMVRIKDGEYVRSPVEWERLNPLARPLLERFVKARLLVIGEREGKNVVEVAHESLLRSWPVLRKWLDAAGEFLIGRRQLDDALAAYQAADDAKKKSALLTALLLDRAHSWLSTYPDLLTHEERLFIAESRAQKDELLQADQARIRELCLWQTRAVARTVEDLLREGQLFQALLLATEPLTSQALAAGMHLAYPTDAEAERVRIEVCRSIQQLKFTDEFGTMCQRVVVSPRRQHVLVITDDHELFLHAAGTATPFRLPQDKRLAAIDAGFNTTETRLIILFSEGQITVCDVPSGAVVSELCIQDGALSSIEIDPSGNYAIVRTDDYQHHIVNLAEQKILGSTQAAPAVVRTGRVKPIWDQSLRLMRREKMSAALPLLGTSTLNGAKPDNLLSAEFSQNGEWLITIASSKVGIWATDPVEERLVLPRFAGPVIFSPDSRTLAVAAWNAKLKLYSLPGCEETHVLAGHTGEVLGAAFAPRSEWLATYSRDKTVRVWTLQTGRERHRLMHHSIPTAIAINADGSRIASVVEDGELYIWDADTGSLIRRVTTLALEKNRTESGVRNLQIKAKGFYWRSMRAT